MKLKTEKINETKTDLKRPIKVATLTESNKLKKCVRRHN